MYNTTSPAPVTGNYRSHCGFCGRLFTTSAWPRECDCGEISYANPISVVVLLVEYRGGILCIERAIEPGKGGLALIGGYHEFGETWQERGATEVYEETNELIRVLPESITLLDVKNPPDLTKVVIFATAQCNEEVELRDFVPTSEAAQLVAVFGPTVLVFSTHTEALELYFSRRSNR